MSDIKNHRSHIGSKRSRARGWRKVPPAEVREETRFMGYQLANCKGCRFADEPLVGTGRPCCTYIGRLLASPDKCLTRIEMRTIKAKEHRDE